MAPKFPERQLERARQLRREQTFAEEMLWRAPRGRRIGMKFRRQVPIGPYIADFACMEAKLIVEVDGPSHETAEGHAHDERRDAWFVAQSWQVLQTTNEPVTGGGDLVLDQIRTALAATPFSRSREKVASRSEDG